MSDNCLRFDIESAILSSSFNDPNNDKEGWTNDVYSGIAFSDGLNNSDYPEFVMLVGPGPGELPISVTELRHRLKLGEEALQRIIQKTVMVNSLREEGYCFRDASGKEFILSMNPVSYSSIAESLDIDVSGTGLFNKFRVFIPIPNHDKLIFKDASKCRH